MKKLLIDHAKKGNKQSHVSFPSDFLYTIYVWVATVINTALEGDVASDCSLSNFYGNSKDSRSRTKEEHSEEPRRLHVSSGSFQRIPSFYPFFSSTRFLVEHFSTM